MISVKILDVSHAPPDDNHLLGRSIDAPRAGSLMSGRTLPIEGWALGRASRVVAVEVIHAGAVIRRVAMNLPRPDVAADYPAVPGAAGSGFRVHVSLLQLPRDGELQVRAVLQTQARVPLGTIHLRWHWQEGDDERAGAPLVSVVIPCYRQARFLHEAIESVVSQSYPHLEVVVVDDGSTDNTEEVAAHYPGVRYIRQENRGLSAARNTGLRRTIGSYLVFLDADDRLLPDAVALGLKEFNAHPDCAFVSGQYRFIDVSGAPLPTIPQPCPESDHYLALLHRNYIWNPGSVVYRRAPLELLGGFDPSSLACGDYDLYLRTAREFSITCHENVVVDYRQHAGSMSADSNLMLESALRVLRSQREHVRGDPRRQAAYRDGIRFYGERIARDASIHGLKHNPKRALQALWTVGRHDAGLAVSFAAQQLLPEPIRLWGAVGSRHLTPLKGEVDFGNLRRLEPIAQHGGRDRGRPIIRYYAERFLSRNSDDVQGRVLEVGTSDYVRGLARNRTSQVDVVQVVDDGGQPITSVNGMTLSALSAADYDCIVVSEAIAAVYDVRAFLRQLHRALKPNGVMLAILPALHHVPLALGEPSVTARWTFTTNGAREVFEEVFPPDNVTVSPRGNVLSMIALLEGLAAEELRTDELTFHDPLRPVAIMVRAANASDRDEGFSSVENSEDVTAINPLPLESIEAVSKQERLRPLEQLIVCPVCKGTLRHDSDLIVCEFCTLNFAQLPEVSRSEHDVFALLPPQFGPLDQEEFWRERQESMGVWYEALISNPTDARFCFAQDYAPHASFLASLSGSVLDLGGGCGLVRHYIPDDTEYTVVDPSPLWLDPKWSSLGRQFPCIAEPLRFVQGVGEFLPFSSEAFDTVLAFWSLNHVVSPEQVFAEAWRVLRPGGRFLVVLEDMAPSSHDLADETLQYGQSVHLSDPNSLVGRCASDVSDPPLDPGHIRISEMEIEAWMHGRFDLMRREWVANYLTLEFARH